MPLTFNIRHLEKRDLHLKGELPVADLDVETHDEVVQLRRPLDYDLQVQLLDDAILVQGKLHLMLDCLCVRCLKPVAVPLNFPDWTLLLPLKGEEKVAVVNDSVDLTPLVREDILLAFPQHPLCKTDCGGLPQKSSKRRKTSDKTPNEGGSSPWAELDKLKL